MDVPPEFRSSAHPLAFVHGSLVSYHSNTMANISTLDLNWTGRPHSIAAALLESGGRHAIVDPGPASTLDTLHGLLKSRGLSVEDLDAVLLTHIHLDHAGATGSLVRENPRLRVYVHSKGATHLVDPAKLLASAGRLWGDDLQRLFGETLPVPAENLTILEGGESIAIGPENLDVVYTPGHASHHLTFFDAANGVAFAGDTAGIRIANGPFVMPATPPPDIDLVLWEKSFQAILERRPVKLFLTHFGWAENPAEHIAKFRERLHLWADITEKILKSETDEKAALQAFIHQTQAEMAGYLGPVEAEQHSFTAGLPLSFLGLARHIRKREKPPSS
jgi:glyoxylase-like metal-dependent hydrolase (beta-lactamase superfamily II)